MYVKIFSRLTNMGVQIESYKTKVFSCLCSTYSACLKSSPGVNLQKGAGICLIYAHKYAHAPFSSAAAGDSAEIAEHNRFD